MSDLRLLQHRDAAGRRRVIASLGGEAWFLSGVSTTLELALEAIAKEDTLAATALSHTSNERVNLHHELDAGRLLVPIDHPDPARLQMTGTGLTHLGSAAGRDAMHKAAAAGRQTDSMRMFLEGVEGGKPAKGEAGAQPEWFYKGDGQALVGPGDTLTAPAFARDGSEEPELAAIYVIAPDGTPCRLGVALGNEFSDHVTERHNYLWLAHSKLRPAALGPELLVGDIPADVRGVSRIIRDGAIAWEKPFLSGEDNMSHSIENLELHHFKYDQFRRPGDVHVHFFGTATLSFSDGFATERGDVFEIEAQPFTLPLRNPLAFAAPAPFAVRQL